MKPILFNTEMVRAILDDRKTATRRIVKPQPMHHYRENCECKGYFDVGGNEWACIQCGGEVAPITGKSKMKAPYKTGDVLYVRETGMIQSMKAFGQKVKMLFKADGSLTEFAVGNQEYERLSKWALLQRWLSPYWLSKETARLFLRVTDVRVKRLQDMNLDDFLSEGVCLLPEAFNDPDNAYYQAKRRFSAIWNSTIKKPDLDRYGWNANPWVWAIEFERIDKDTAIKEGTP